MALQGTGSGAAQATRCQLMLCGLAAATFLLFVTRLAVCLHPIPLRRRPAGGGHCAAVCEPGGGLGTAAVAQQGGCGRLLGRARRTCGRTVALFHPLVPMLGGASWICWSCCCPCSWQTERRTTEQRQSGRSGMRAREAAAAAGASAGRLLDSAAAVRHPLAGPEMNLIEFRPASLAQPALLPSCPCCRF